MIPDNQAMLGWRSLTICMSSEPMKWQPFCCLGAPSLNKTHSSLCWWVMNWLPPCFCLDSCPYLYLSLSTHLVSHATCQQQEPISDVISFLLAFFLLHAHCHFRLLTMTGTLACHKIAAFPIYLEGFLLLDVLPQSFRSARDALLETSRTYKEAILMELSPPPSPFRGWVDPWCVRSEVRPFTIDLVFTSLW